MCFHAFEKIKEAVARANKPSHEDNEQLTRGGERVMGVQAGVMQRVTVRVSHV